MTKKTNPEDRGCQCIGECKPDTCHCAQVQAEYWEQETPGFAYNSDKRLEVSTGYIVECNASCSCDDRCINKVLPFVAGLCI